VTEEKRVCIDIALNIKSSKYIVLKKRNKSILKFFIHEVQHFFGVPPMTVRLTPIRVPPVDPWTLG